MYCFKAYFQKQVIAHSLYKAILENIEKYVSNEILVEVAFEIFIILLFNGECSFYFVV